MVDARTVNKPEPKRLTPAQSDLLALLRRGPQTAEELAQQFGYSARAARQHLSALIAHGAVEASGGRGHPTQYRAS